MRNGFPVTALVVLAFLAWAGGDAAAQVPTNLPDEAPLTFGKTQLFPVYAVDLGWTDNLYYYPTSDDPDLQPISTAYTSIAPGFVLEIPFSQSHARVGYVLDYRGYTTNAIDAHFDQFFVGEGEFRFANGLELGVRDDFQQGVLDTKVFDEGGGVTFQGDSFRSNDARVDFSHSLGTSRVLGFSAYNHRINFIERISGYFDTNEDGADLSGQHQLAPAFRLEWELAYSRAFLTRPATAQYDAEERTEKERSWKVGGAWLLGEGSALQFRVGWQHNRTESSDPSTLQLVTGGLTYSRGVPAGAQLGVDLARDVYPAIYGQNNVYISNRLAVTFSNDPRAQVTIGASAGFWFNRFPVANPQGVTREDTTLAGGAWIGYRLGRWTIARLSVRTEHRSSTVPGFDYDVNSVEATISLGS